MIDKKLEKLPDAKVSFLQKTILWDGWWKTSRGKEIRLSF